ncbi:unnamed protein product [Periconia digitata]|uniref:Lipid droplet-associated hydrolase n=1 Tax=Periconia digitata TaxID=1303443 RepID=A0A9W4URE6_9PLEO|nr:unnamed protein product [Periconia digitata]
MFSSTTTVSTLFFSNKFLNHDTGSPVDQNKTSCVLHLANMTTIPQTPPNKLLFTRPRHAPDSHTSNTRAKYLIFFIPGNPGIIQYYSVFLKNLHEKLAHGLKPRVDVLGITLAGFECGASEHQDVRNKAKKFPLSIDDQIDFVERTLRDYTEPDTRIILMGHSFGVYIFMEMLRRRQSRLKTTGHVIGAIGLFPGVVHLARSQGGRRGQQWLAIPGLAFLLIWLARALGLLLPTKILQNVIRALSGYPDHAVRTTVHWIRSRWGLQQSLHLVREELIRITDDAWDDEVWGTDIHMLFGEKDVYVPEIERDALISARAVKSAVQTGSTPYFEIAATGIPHDFSIRHNAPVAEKVDIWVRKIISQDEA